MFSALHCTVTVGSNEQVTVLKGLRFQKIIFGLPQSWTTHEQFELKSHHPNRTTRDFYTRPVQSPVGYLSQTVYKPSYVEMSELFKKFSGFVKFRFGANQFGPNPNFTCSPKTGVWRCLKVSPSLVPQRTTRSSSSRRTPTWTFLGQTRYTHRKSDSWQLCGQAMEEPSGLSIRSCIHDQKDHLEVKVAVLR